MACPAPHASCRPANGSLAQHPAPHPPCLASPWTRLELLSISSLKPWQLDAGLQANVNSSHCPGMFGQISTVRSYEVERFLWLGTMLVLGSPFLQGPKSVLRSWQQEVEGKGPEGEAGGQPRSEANQVWPSQARQLMRQVMSQGTKAEGGRAGHLTLPSCLYM